MQEAVKQQFLKSKQSFAVPALAQQQLELAKIISENYELHLAIGRVLAARGFEPGKDLDNFLKPSLREGLPPPSDVLNLMQAAQAVLEAISKNEKIAITCDFDADGLSAGSLLQNFFQILKVDSKVLVPDRFKEGYGLNNRIIEQAKLEGRSLLITVDFGSSNNQELELARSLGIKTIVIDHHQVGDLVSSADFFINPQQSACGFAAGTLSAAGLAWYFVAAMRAAIPAAANIDTREFLDFSCLGTVCDMVPLVGVNRIIACKGIERFPFTRWVGLKALMNAAGVRNKVKCSDLSFLMGPRINAAGRMDSGELVIELLTTNDASRAQTLAAKLNRMNQQRQQQEEQAKQAAISYLSKLDTLPDGLVYCDESCHIGVLGIVAQRLVETFMKPSAVLGSDGKVFKGSLRGVKGFDVYQALVNLSDLFDKFGGHKSAGGFSLKLGCQDEFAVRFAGECTRQLASEFEHQVNADTFLSLDEVSIDLFEQISKLAPFGIANPAPIFLFQNLTVKNLRSLQQQHLKLNLSDGKRSIDALLWRVKSHPALSDGSVVNVAAKLELNVYSGRRDLQLNLQAITSA